MCPVKTLNDTINHVSGDDKFLGHRGLIFSPRCAFSNLQYDSFRQFCGMQIASLAYTLRVFAHPMIVAPNETLAFSRFFDVCLLSAFVQMGWATARRIIASVQYENRRPNAIFQKERQSISTKRSQGIASGESTIWLQLTSCADPFPALALRALTGRFIHKLPKTRNLFLIQLRWSKIDLHIVKASLSDVLGLRVTFIASPQVAF